MNMFELASRTKLRFNTHKGDLTVEQVWDLPLTSEKNLSLNGIGMGLQRAMREMGEDSLIQTTAKNPEREKAALCLDIVKHMITVKQAENEAARAAVEKKAEKQKLLELLEVKQHQKLANMSEDEIRQRLEAL